MSDKKNINEVIDVIMTEKDVAEYSEVMEKINDLYSKNMHKAYGKFVLSFHENKEYGTVLTLDGVRQETKDEMEARLATEEARRKQIEAAEIKEYLKLHKKYGKKKKLCDDGSCCN